MQIDRRVYALIGVVILVGLVVAGFLTYQRQSQGILDLTVVPQDATVTIDNQKTAKPGSISLSAGQHSLTVSREGFASQSFDIQITAGQHQSQEIALETATNAGVDYLKNNPDQARKAEGIVGKRVDETAQSINDKYPILAQLPIERRTFIINYGKSQKHPDDPNAIALYITIGNDAGKKDALDWLDYEGYRASDYEIIYQSPPQ